MSNHILHDHAHVDFQFVEEKLFINFSGNDAVFIKCVADKTIKLNSRQKDNTNQDFLQAKNYTNQDFLEGQYYINRDFCKITLIYTH